MHADIVRREWRGSVAPAFFLLARLRPDVETLRNNDRESRAPAPSARGHLPPPNFSRGGRRPGRTTSCALSKRMSVDEVQVRGFTWLKASFELQWLGLIGLTAFPH